MSTDIMTVENAMTFGGMNADELWEKIKARTLTDEEMTSIVETIKTDSLTQAERGVLEFTAVLKDGLTTKQAMTPRTDADDAALCEAIHRFIHTDEPYGAKLHDGLVEFGRNPALQDKLLSEFTPEQRKIAEFIYKLELAYADEADRLNQLEMTGESND
jgi:hypothetical protein